MKTDNNQEKIVLPEEVQKNILKFFLKTSIPRIARQEQEKKALSEKEGQGKDEHSHICQSFD